MPDLSKLSDADLEALSRNDLSKVSDEGLGLLSLPDTPSGSDRAMSAAGYLPPVAIAKYAINHPQEMKAGLEHFGNAASLGYLPQLQSATEPATSKFLDLITGGDVSSNLPGYVARRDENIARLAQESEQSPIASKVGSVAGTIAGAGALAGATPITALSVPGRIAQAAGYAGAIGAAANPGDTQGEMGAQIVDRIKNGALSAPLGAAGQAAGELAGYVGDKLGDVATTKAVKAAGANKTAIKNLTKQDRLKDVGQTLLDERVVTPLATPKDISGRLSDKEALYESQLGDLIGKLSGAQKDLNVPPINPSEIADSLKNGISERYSEIPVGEYQPALDKIDSFLGNRGPLDLDKAQKMKVQMNQFLKDSDFIREPGIQKQGVLAVRQGLRQGIENNADAIASILGEEGGQVSAVNRRLGNIYTAQKIAEDAAASAEAGRTFSLGDHVAGAAGSMVGRALNPTKMGSLEGWLGGEVVSKLGRKYGNSLEAVGANSLSKLLKDPSVSKLILNNPAMAPVIEQNILRQNSNPNDKLDAINRRLSNLQ